MSNFINPSVSDWSNGIITYLNSEHPDNLYDYIDVTPSSTNYEDQRDGANALINQTFYSDSNPVRTHWCSQNIPNSYFILKFPLFYVSPTFYSFESRNSNDNRYPKLWTIEGSIDNIKWDIISKEEGENSMIMAEKNTFSFQKHGVFKYIKFIQNKSQNENENTFCLQKIELFGALIYRIPSFCSRKLHLSIPPFFIFILNL